MTCATVAVNDHTCSGAETVINILTAAATFQTTDRHVGRHREAVSSPDTFE